MCHTRTIYKEMGLVVAMMYLCSAQLRVNTSKPEMAGLPGTRAYITQIDAKLAPILTLMKNKNNTLL